MKSRSYKLSTKDDWVEEESWTVDCVCGVNFDDGEEMVNCDDCGVWVHTRCSRYVKSEESFACDKCKNRKSRNDSEETEVAQLLVELPTKTLRMESSTSYVPSTLPAAPTLAPAYTKRCRLWTDIPIKERVHVQGIPGVGDNPSMFSGVSSIFGPQLWKSTGYVPKKFDFHFQDFQSWEEEEDLQKENVAVSVSRVDNTVNIFDSANCDIPADPLEDRGIVEDKNGDGKHEKLETTEQGTNLDSSVSDVSRPHICVRKDQILLQSSHIRPVDHKENHGMLKYRSSRKKTRIMENQGELKRKNLCFLGPALTNPSNCMKLQRHEERGPSAQKDDPQGNHVLKSSDTLPAYQMSGIPVVRQSDGNKSNSIPNKEQDLDVARNQFVRAEITEEGNTGCPVPEDSEDHRKTIVNDAILLNSKQSRGVQSEAQVASNSHDNTSRLEGRLGGQISSSKSGIASTDVRINHPGNILDSKEGIQDICGLNVESSPVDDLILETSETRTQCQEIYADCPTNSARFSDGAFSFPKSCTEVEDVSRDLKVDNYRSDTVDDVSPVAHPRTRHDSGGSEDRLAAKKSSKESNPKISDEPPKTSCSTVGPSLAIGESDLIVSVGSSSSITSAVSLKSHALESCTSASAKSEYKYGRQKKSSESNPGSNKDYDRSLTEADQGGGSPERPKILLTKFSRSSHGSVAKTTQMKKVFHSSNSKRTFADSEPTTPSAGTLPSVPTISDAPQSVRASSSGPEIASDVENKSSTLHTESASNMPKKVINSVLPQKAEKINQPASQLSSKVNSSLTHLATSSNSTTPLSDEELALLLHQELNSSPRVPRVPRMRHAGSLPQLTPSTATSMMKRTSSAVGKEHGLVPRRREKDFPKDGSHGLRDGDDQTKKTVRPPPLSDQDGQDSGWNRGPVSKRELGSGSAKRTAAASATTSSSDLLTPVRATERHYLASNQSPRNPCDDDDMVVLRHPRTLPGLIAEIMSKGQRMTYEELCNAVLPHWPNLRKHNGERYAYASHSQAVLDCLRNRNEWARLVDRGPKTTGGRRRRKLDSEYPDVDSEDDDDGRHKTRKNFRSKNTETSHEDLSKGKRKAWNWTLKGRFSSRRRQRIEEFSEDESDSYVNSSEDTSVSEDDIQGGIASADRADISASSDGIENI